MSEIKTVTVLDYSKKMEQLCREACLLKKDRVIKLREVLWMWQVRGRQGWLVVVMQDVIRDEVGKGNVVTAGFFSWEKKFQIDCLPPPFETSSVVLKHMGILSVYVLSTSK